MFCTFYISTSRSLCAVPNVAVFCSSLILCFPGYVAEVLCLSDFEMVPVAPIIYGHHFGFYSPRALNIYHEVYYYYYYYYYYLLLLLHSRFYSLSYVIYKILMLWA